MAESRSDIRKARYSKLRELGFTSKEAARFRDYSTIQLQKVIIQREENLKAIKKLTPKQAQQLDRIESERPRFTTSTVGTRNQRLQNFRNWSKRKSFPREIDDFIVKANDEAGKRALDSYGYRLFYHMYVNKLPEAEAIRKLESNDT